MTNSKPMGRISKQGSAQNPLTISDAPKRPERLAQVNFSMMKEAALRKKLGEMGISASGNKPLMERRYTEWITLWNANCDSRKPKTKGELKRELEVWERTQGGRAQTSTYGQHSGTQVKDKDFDGKAYSSTHDDSFRKLIANARKKTAKPPTPEASSPGNQTPVVTEPPGNSNEDVMIREDGDGPNDRMQPVSQSGSQRRFLEESSQPAKSPSNSSSQFANNLTILDKDSGIAPELPAIRTVQP